MKKLNCIMSVILALCFVLCTACIPAYAENRAVTPAGKAYESVMENGYHAISTEEYFACLDTFYEMVYLLTGRQISSGEHLNLVLDETLYSICFQVAQATGFDVNLLSQRLPYINGFAVEVTEKCDLDPAQVQKVLRFLSQIAYDNGDNTKGAILSMAAAYMGIIEEFYFYCVPVEGLDNTCEVYCRLTYRDGSTEHFATGTYYNLETQELYGKNDNGLLNVGFDLKVDEAFLTSPTNGWMRNFGFCFFYDFFCYVTPFINYRTARIKFEYDNAEWMIQLWKGCYVVTNGGEVGIYKRELGSKGTYYDCAGDEDMLLMSLDVYHGDDQIVHRDPMYHWWITGFQISDTVYLPQSLLLKSDITFKDTEMVKAFCDGIENRNFDDIKYEVNGLTVSIEW